MSKKNIAAIIFFIVGFLILLEQYFNYGVWFQIKDIHHETFALTSFALGVGVLIGKTSSKK